MEDHRPSARVCLRLGGWGTAPVQRPRLMTLPQGKTKPASDSSTSCFWDDGGEPVGLRTNCTDVKFVQEIQLVFNLQQQISSLISANVFLEVFPGMLLNE